MHRLARVSHGVDRRPARCCKARLGTNVLAEPEPDVEIIDFTLADPMLAVRPYCHNDHYWQVYFDTNRPIAESFGEVIEVDISSRRDPPWAIHDSTARMARSAVLKTTIPLPSMAFANES